jgi:lipopolysaccharide transport system ATP-binding protein
MTPHPADSPDAPAIHLEGLCKRFQLVHDRPKSVKDAVIARLTFRPDRREPFFALRDVALDVYRGESVALIGENGSGKSTLLAIISRILQPTSGVLEVRGRISVLLEVGAGFHPDLTGIENIYLSGAILGLSRAEMDRRLADIIAFAELEQFADVPVRTYSVGMYLRLGFAVATHVDPDILLVDEALAVGDEHFQTKCYRKLEEMSRENRALVFVSHDMDEVRRLCPRSVWLDQGRVMADGPTDEVISRYLAHIGQTP